MQIIPASTSGQRLVLLQMQTSKNMLQTKFERLHGSSLFVWVGDLAIDTKMFSCLEFTCSILYIFLLYAGLLNYLICPECLEKNVCLFVIFIGRPSSGTSTLVG